MGLLPDTQICGLRMRRECRGRFPRHRLQRKLLVSDLGMHHGTYATHVPWCMSGSLTRGGGEYTAGIPGACATRNFTYLSRGRWAQPSPKGSENLGAVTIYDISTKRKSCGNAFDHNTVAHLPNRGDILHRVRQYHCRALCKLSIRFDN